MLYIKDGSVLITKYFLDISITHTINGKYKFKLHLKRAITKIIAKPTSSIPSNTIGGVSKGFLQCAHLICSEKYINQEVKFLFDMFDENGHSKSFLENFFPKYQNFKKNNNKKNSFESINK